MWFYGHVSDAHTYTNIPLTSSIDEKQFLSCFILYLFSYICHKYLSSEHISSRISYISAGFFLSSSSYPFFVNKFTMLLIDYFKNRTKRHTFTMFLSNNFHLLFHTMFHINEMKTKTYVNKHENRENTAAKLLLKLEKYRSFNKLT